MRTKNVPALFNHQLQALQFISNKENFALFMEQGTGKSKVIVEQAFYLWEKGDIDCVIIIAPNAVKPQWVEEQFPEHSPSASFRGFIWDGCGTKRSQKEFQDALSDKGKLFIFSLNIESLQSDSIDLYFKRTLLDRKCFVVVDESTRIKNGRRKPKKGKRSGAKRTNKLLDYAPLMKYRSILTGTPTPKSPFDLWSQFEFLEKDFFKMDYFFFTHYYGIMIQHSTQEGKRYYAVLDEKTFNILKSELKKQEVSPRYIEELSLRFGMSTKDILTVKNMEKYSGYKNMEELRDRISRVTFFVKKKDCLDLPDKVYEKLYCTMGKAQETVYKTLKKELYAQYAGKELTITNKVVLTLRLQMITGGLFPFSDMAIKLNAEGEEYMETVFGQGKIEDNGKIKVLLEDLEEVSDDTHIIIWACFRGEIELIEEELLNAGYSCEKYYGGSDDSVIDRFKRGETRILISNPVKGGEGLNLQISTLQYYYSNSFRADARLQAEDRSHRIGQTNKVTYKDLICKGTIDERIYDVLKRKEDLINYFRSGGDVL